MFHLRSLCRVGTCSKITEEKYNRPDIKVKTGKANAEVAKARAVTVTEINYTRPYLLALKDKVIAKAIKATEEATGIRINNDKRRSIQQNTIDALIMKVQ